MTNPQQPELARNRRGGTSQDARKITADNEPMNEAGTGPVPLDQQEGWRQQAKPRPAKRRDDSTT